MHGGALEKEAVLFDEEGAIADAAEAGIDGDEEIGFLFAVFEPELSAEKADFFLDGGEEDDVAIGADVLEAEDIERVEEGDEGTGVIADAGGVVAAVVFADLDLRAHGEDGVHVSGEDELGAAPGALEGAPDVADGILLDAGKADAGHGFFHVLDAELFLFGGGGDFGELDPCAFDGGFAGIDFGEGLAHGGAFGHGGGEGGDLGKQGQGREEQKPKHLPRIA